MQKGQICFFFFRAVGLAISKVVADSVKLDFLSMAETANNQKLTEKFPLCTCAIPHDPPLRTSKPVELPGMI